MEHLTQKQIEDYSLHRLTPAELLAVSDHLNECETCRLHLESRLGSDASFVAVHEQVMNENGARVHLTNQQNADYIDQNLRGEALEFVNDHLSSCEQCAVAVKDLRAFRNNIAPSLDREYGPTTAEPVAKTGWREKFITLFKAAPVPAFGGAVLATLLLATIGWIIWRTPRENKQEIAVVPTPVVQPTPAAEPSVTPETPATPVVAQLNDGNGVVTLDQQGRLSGADNLPIAYQNLVKKALTSERIERSSQLQGLTRASGTLMGADTESQGFAVIEPLGNVVLSNQPTFRWSMLPGATGYVVEIYDDQFTLVASSPESTKTSWTATTPLARGRVYSWQVKAMKDDQQVTTPRPPASQAKFRVLDQGKANEIAQARRAYASSHLTLGLLYADAGLLREAEQEFRLLQRANPESEIARKMLAQVQSLRRD